MLGRAGVMLRPIWGRGQWYLAAAGDGAFGFGYTEVCQEGKMSTAGKEGSHSAAWEGEMEGVMPGCSPAPEPWDCVNSWPVYRIDPRIGWVVTSDGDVPTSLPSSNPFSGGKHLLTFPQAVPRALTQCPALFGLTGWGDQTGL